MDFSESESTLTRLLKFKTTLLIAVLAVIALSIITVNQTQHRAIQKQMQAAYLTPHKPVNIGAFPIAVPTMKYGFAIDTFVVTEGIIKNNQFLADILIPHHVGMADIERLVQKTKEVFSFTKLRVDKPYTILSTDTTQRADYFIYEPSVFKYYVFDLKNLTGKEVVRTIDTEVKVASGVIESSLWNAMVNNGMSFDLASKMESALQWSIDFHHLQKNDKFKLLYEQKYIDGEPVGVGEVFAAYYKTAKNEYHALHYEAEDGNAGYFDECGQSMKSLFLKSPVQYSRISSKFNLRRFHPILKRVRPHLGTDYAAPYGTPILSVGNGVVVEATRRGGNGRFVKIRHNETYQTQYLHMQGFADGIHPGAQVKQGQVIGYVGSSGLATGPHVCFRFWKNGKQVNHLGLNFPDNIPLNAEQMVGFEQVREEYLKQLNSIDYKTFEDKKEEAIEEELEREEEVVEKALSMND